MPSDGQQAACSLWMQARARGLRCALPLLQTRVRSYASRNQLAVTQAEIEEGVSGGGRALAGHGILARWRRLQPCLCCPTLRRHRGIPWPHHSSLFTLDRNPPLPHSTRCPDTSTPCLLLWAAGGPGVGPHLPHRAGRGWQAPVRVPTAGGHPPALLPVAQASTARLMLAWGLHACMHVLCLPVRLPCWPCVSCSFLAERDTERRRRAGRKEHADARLDPHDCAATAPMPCCHHAGRQRSL